MLKITKYLDPRLVVFPQGKTRDEVIEELVTAASEANKLKDSKIFYDAIIEREKIVTTGIGMGVAIPHAKLLSLEDFFIVIGLLKKGIDWKALDGGSVRLIFMIGGPDDKQTEYLQILSSLTAALKDEERRKKIMAATMPEEVLALFNAF